MARFGEINAQYFDDAGDPLGSGKLYFYNTGTTTPKTTFSDVNLSIPNTHPVVLTASGRQPNIFFNGNAKAILTDKNDVQILARDPVGETGTSFGDPWSATRTYSNNAVVIASDGQYYRSTEAGNQNNDPTLTSGFWVLLYSVEWNSGISYNEGAVVTYDGDQYQSIQGSNLNNSPNTSPLYWALFSLSWISTATYADNQNVVGSDGVLYTSQQAANLNNDPTDAGNRPTWWVGTSADAAASAAAAAASEAAAAASEASASADAASASSDAASASADAASASSDAAAASADAASASSSASSAATSASDAADKYDEFDDRYLGQKASDPSVDNDGNALLTGAIYWNTSSNVMRVYTGSVWVDVAPIATTVTISQISDYTGTPTQLNYTDDLTGQVQAQLDSKAVYPDQTGNAGKYLSTDGSTASWAALDTFSESKAYFFSGF